MNFSFCTRVAVTAMKSIFSAVCTIDCSQTENAKEKILVSKHHHIACSPNNHPIKALNWYKKN